MLKIDCTPGQQKRVGRPRQAASSRQRAAEANATISPPASSRGSEGDRSPFASDYQRQSAEEGLGSRSMNSTAPITATAPSFMDDAIPTTQGWSTTATDAPGLDLSIWDTLGDGYHTSMLYSMDMESWLTAPSTESIDKSAAPVPHNVPPTTISWAPDTSGEGIESSEAISRLSKINLDLHIRIATLESHKSNIDLDSFLYAKGPLFIDNQTLAVFMLKTSREFLRVLTQLLNDPPRNRSGRLQDLQTHFSGASLLSGQSDGNAGSGQASPSCSSQLSPSPELLGSPLALTIISIFTQLIILYEASVEHLAARMENLSTNPIAVIPGLSFAGLPLRDPCTQGMLFTNMIINMLDGMELALGIHKMTQRHGQYLLSPRQIDVLWSELDGASGPGWGHGTGRPTRVRKNLGEMSVLLTQLSLGT